jgi:ribosome-associated protein
VTTPPEHSGETLRVNRYRAIPLAELEWSFTASGGPGGQHANTSNTRAEVRFDIASSGAFPPHERDRLIERLGPIVRVAASDERSQYRNRELALERLAKRIADALRVDPPRVATRPTRGSKERRLVDKRLRSETKAARQRPNRDD